MYTTYPNSRIQNNMNMDYGLRCCCLLDLFIYVCSYLAKIGCFPIYVAVNNVKRKQHESNYIISPDRLDS